MNNENNNIDNLLKKYYNNYDNFIIVPESISYTIETTMYDYKRKKFDLKLLIKKIIISIMGLITLSGGLVFAKNYLSNKFGISNGIETAIENGYIYEKEKKLDNIETINASEIQASIDEFLMDDQNISTNFSFKFNDELLENLNIDSVKRIELMDLIITDENNTILYCASEDALNEFCQINNLNYKFAEFNEMYLNCGLNSFLQPSSENDTICLTYNIYSGNLESGYPKSKSLKFKFHQIALIENYEEKSNNKILGGDWEINIEVPEKMYNRQTINYKVVECSDENIEISTAKVSDTGFEFGCTIKNVELPEELKLLREEMKSLSEKALSDEEMKELALKYMESDFTTSPIKPNYNPNLGETIENCTYIENQNDEKFLISTNPGRLQKGELINDDTEYVLYETFDLTKYDITDELTVHLKFYDNSISIKLRKNI